MSSMPLGVELNRLATRWAAHPNSTCFAALADALRKRGALDDAAAVATAGVAARPEFLPGYLVLARIHTDRQQWDDAYRAIQSALLLDASHPMALEARDTVARRRSATGEVAGAPEAGQQPTGTAIVALVEELDDLVYSDDDETVLAVPEPVLTESLAMVYRGQGHLAEAVEVLDALVARAPGNAELTARRDALREELDEARPRPFNTSQSGGVPVRRWLAGLASAPAPVAPPVSGFDAFFEAPAAAASQDGDLAAFQAWLRELDR